MEDSGKFYENLGNEGISVWNFGKTLDILRKVAWNQEKTFDKVLEKNFNFRENIKELLKNCLKNFGLILRKTTVQQILHDNC